MSSVRIVRADSTNADFIELVALLDRELRVRDGDEHAFFAAYNRIDSLAQVVVAYQAHVPVGCGAFKKYSDDTAEIKRMFVAPDMRGRGIAGEILAELERWAVESGFSRCILETGKKQPEAIRLYQKSGYTLIPNYGQYANVESSVCMERRLHLQAEELAHSAPTKDTRSINERQAGIPRSGSSPHGERGGSHG